MPPVSRRFLLTGAALTAASLLIPISARRALAATSKEAAYEITDWIMSGSYQNRQCSASA